MNIDTSYTREITVSNEPNAAYQALTASFDKWWTTDCNSISSIGDEITFRFGSTYWVMRATNLVPSNLVELECIEAHHLHDGLPSSIHSEWQGTKLKWKIEGHGGQTKILLVHDGLVPSLDCYDVCEQGWDYFFVYSLKKYLNTGKGTPFVNETK